jgi:hypothetical protein
VHIPPTLKVFQLTLGGSVTMAPVDALLASSFGQTPHHDHLDLHHLVSAPVVVPVPPNPAPGFRASNHSALFIPATNTKPQYSPTAYFDSLTSPYHQIIEPDIVHTALLAKYPPVGISSAPNSTYYTG